MRFSQWILYAMCVLAAPAWGALPEDLDRELEARINRQLEAILGPGKAQVTVQSQIDTSQRQSRSRTRSNGQISAERSLSETSATGSRTRTERQYTYSETETLHVDAPYRLQGRSIAVQYQPPSPQEGEEAAAFNLDPAAITRMVKAMAGLKERDAVDVQPVTFATSAYDRLRAEMEAARNAGPPWWLLALIGGGGITLGLGTGWLIARRRAQKQLPVEMAAYSYGSVYPALAPAEDTTAQR
jgi:flagellar biosynthesis/type III secretory pathway M-ring protein FliF/YscJ